MKTVTRTSVVYSAAIATALTLTGVSSALAENFQITIKNLSPNVLTPAPFITHSAGFDLFDSGAVASPALEALAEDGMTGGVVGMATGFLGTTVADVGVAGMAPIGPGGSESVTLMADPAHPFLSFASMLAFSNDAFIGAAAGDGAFDLFPGGSPFVGSWLITDGAVWDAGSERNDELAAHVPALMGGGGVAENGFIMSPHAGIIGIGDIPIDRNWVGGNVALISVRSRAHNRDAARDRCVGHTATTTLDCVDTHPPPDG